MKEWILSVCAVTILTVIVGMILPQGKMGKFIKSIFSLIIMLVILKPILSFDLDDLHFDMGVGNTEVVYQKNYLDYVNQKKIDSVESDCADVLYNIGVSGANILLDFSTDENYEIMITKVNINLENAVIISGNKHIDIIEEIKNALSEYLSVNKEIMVIYG